MAEYGLTPSGYLRKRLAVIKTALETSMKSIWGDDIDLDPESGFGQFIGIISEALADENESQDDVHNSQYPSTASGASLSNVVPFHDLTRQEETKSTCDSVVISGAVNTVIPKDSFIDVSGTLERFVTDTEVTIPVGGSIGVTVTAQDFGVISAASGSLTVIGSPIFGWVSVTNTTDAIVGREEETDADLRDRREQSTLTLGQNLADSLFGQLLDVEGVEDAVVVNNRTDSVDVNGIPAHEFLSVVSGGLAADIASIIWGNTPQGIASFGALTEVIVDAQGFSQDVKYSRASDINIYLKMDITTDSTLFPASGSDDIKAACVAYGLLNFKISDDVIRSGFYTAINATPGITSIDLRIGIAPAPAGTANIVIDVDEISRYSIARVEVNIV